MLKSIYGFDSFTKDFQRGFTSLKISQNRKKIIKTYKYYVLICFDDSFQFASFKIRKSAINSFKAKRFFIIQFIL
jgi:hypothetical protein